jgi:hypothetical protein
MHGQLQRGQPLSAEPAPAGSRQATRPVPLQDLAALAHGLSQADFNLPPIEQLAALAQGLSQADFNLLLHLAAILATPARLSLARDAHRCAPTQIPGARAHFNCLLLLAKQLADDDLRLLAQFAALLAARPEPANWRHLCELIPKPEPNP